MVFSDVNNPKAKVPSFPKFTAGEDELGSYLLIFLKICSNQQLGQVILGIVTECVVDWQCLASLWPPIRWWSKRLQYLEKSLNRTYDLTEKGFCRKFIENPTWRRRTVYHQITKYLHKRMDFSFFFYFFLFFMNRNTERAQCALSWVCIP